MKLKVFVITSLLVTSLFSYCQENYLIHEINFLPLRYYVGDKVELRIRIGLPDNGMLTAPDPLPQGTWLKIEEVSCIKIRAGEWEIRVFFTSFMPGENVLPEIDLGTIVLSDLMTETRSIIEDKDLKEPAAFRGQLVLPGTWRNFLLAMLFLILIPPLLYKLIRIVSKIAVYYRRKRKFELPGNRMRRVLKSLQRGLADNSPRFFFIQIIQAVREYLSARLFFSASKTTTRELKNLIPELLADLSTHDPDSLSRGIISLFEYADKVKFGGLSATVEEMKVVLAQVDGFVESIEEAVYRVES